MASKDKKKKKKRPDSQAADGEISLNKLPPEELRDLLNHGHVFREFMAAARKIEQRYLKWDRTRSDVLAAAATVRKGLNAAMSQVGGCAFGADPIPVPHIYAGLIDVEGGTYNKLLSPAQHQFGEQYTSHHRLMIIGHADG
jgi:hypothetical protein